MKETIRQVPAYAQRVQRLLDLWHERPALRLVVRCVSGLCAGFVLAGSRFAGGFLPFSLCLTAAMPLGAGSIGAALGGCAGYLLFWGIDIALEPISVMLLILAAMGIFYNTTLQDQFWFMAAICAGMSGLVGIVFLLDGPVTLLRVSLLVSRCVLGFGATVAYRAAMQRQEGACLFLIGCIISGLASIQLGGICNPGIVAAVALGVFAALLKHGMVVAAACGIAVDLAGGCSFPMSAVLCLAVIAVRNFHQRLPGYRIVGIALGCAGAVLFFALLPDISLFSASLGMAVGLSLPQQLQSQKKTVQQDETVKIQQRLYRISQVLDDMRQTAQRASAPQIGITPEMVYDHAAEKVCRCCAQFHTCWETDAEETYRALSMASSAVLSRGKAEATDFPEAFSARCRHLDGFTTAVNQELDGLLYRRQYRIRTAEQQKLLGLHLECLSRLLRDTAAEADWQFPATPRYRMEIGSAVSGKLNDSDCGDQWACFVTEPTVCYVLLSDGMGTGEEAAHESKTAISLLADLLRSGCEPNDALQMLNSLYILRGDGVFSAVDVLRLDLASGEAALYKWGGATTYLKRGGTVKKLGTASPPPGIGVGLDQGPERISLSLQKGEMLVLTTDGVSAEETTARIAGYQGTNLKEFAAYVIAGAQLSGNDDMTAIALCLYPRHKS